MSFAMPLFHDEYSCGVDLNKMEYRTRARRAQQHADVVEGGIVGGGRRRPFPPHLLNDRSRSEPVFDPEKLAAAAVRFKVENETATAAVLNPVENGQDEATTKTECPTSSSTTTSYGSIHKPALKKKHVRVAEIRADDDENDSVESGATTTKPSGGDRRRSLLVLLRRLSSKEFSHDSLDEARKTEAKEKVTST